jgi:hypothetical protein
MRALSRAESVFKFIWSHRITGWVLSLGLAATCAAFYAWPKPAGYAVTILGAVAGIMTFLEMTITQRLLLILEIIGLMGIELRDIKIDQAKMQQQFETIIGDSLGDPGYVVFGGQPTSAGDLQMMVSNTNAGIVKDVEIEIRNLPLDGKWPNHQAILESLRNPTLIHIGDVVPGFRAVPFKLPPGRYYIDITTKRGYFNEKFTAIRDSSANGFRYNTCIMGKGVVLSGPCEP